MPRFVTSFIAHGSNAFFNAFMEINRRMLHSKPSLYVVPQTVLDFVFYSYFSSHHQERLDHQLFHAFRHICGPVRRNKLVQLIHFLLIAVVTQICAFYDFTLQPLRTRSLTFTTNANLVRERRVFFHPTVEWTLKRPNKYILECEKLNRVWPKRPVTINNWKRSRACLQYKLEYYCWRYKECMNFIVFFYHINVN